MRWTPPVTLGHTGGKEPIAALSRAGRSSLGRPWQHCHKKALGGEEGSGQMILASNQTTVTPD
jgi:hypothetical protein